MGNKYITVQIKVKEPKQSSTKEWTQPASTKATADGSKRKAEVLAESSKKKFMFNKRGKLKDDELIELARTKKNIFSWLKPTPPPRWSSLKRSTLCGRRGLRGSD